MIVFRSGSALLFLLSAGAAGMDLDEEAVPNGWILFGVLAIGLDSLAAGREVRFWSVWIPFGLLFPFFLFRMIGAGDIKCLMMTALVMTPWESLSCLFWTFVFGALAAGVRLIGDRDRGTRLQYFRNYTRGYLSSGIRRSYMRKGKRRENLHMTLPILAAVLLWCGGFY